MSSACSLDISDGRIDRQSDPSRHSVKYPENATKTKPTKVVETFGIVAECQGRRFLHLAYLECLDCDPVKVR